MLNDVGRPLIMSGGQRFDPAYLHQTQGFRVMSKPLCLLSLHTIFFVARYMEA